MSLFVWYFGTTRQYPDVPHHMMVLGPRYKELLQDIFKRQVLAKDFSLYLHRPTATDPSMAPDGCDAFYVLAPVPHLDSGTDWAATAEPYRQAVADALDVVMPGFQKHIATSRVTTPQDFHDRLLSFKGAAFGLEPLLLQSAWFRPHNRSEDIEHLFMVGASTHPGAGVPGVLTSAKALESVVPDITTVRQGGRSWTLSATPSPQVADQRHCGSVRQQLRPGCLRAPDAGRLQELLRRLAGAATESARHLPPPCMPSAGWPMT